jgi:hypothetical protein
VLPLAVFSAQVQATAQARSSDPMNLYDLYADALEKVAKNAPTSPEKWARAKAQARAKFDVYPSAYANGWAAKKYKAMGGGWKKEAELDKEAFYAALGRAALAVAKPVLKGAKRFMTGKKGTGVIKRTAHTYKRVGQVSAGVGVAQAVGGAAKSLSGKVAPNTPPTTASAGPKANTPSPPPSI